MGTRGLDFLADATVYTGTESNTNRNHKGPRERQENNLGYGGDTGIIPQRVQFRATNLKNSVRSF